MLTHGVTDMCNSYHAFLYRHLSEDGWPSVIITRKCDSDLTGLTFNKRLILGWSPPLWDNRPDSLIMAWGPEARRTLLGWKADYLIMEASNQVINLFNTNALQNQIPVDPNVLSPFHVVAVVVVFQKNN